MKRLTRSFFARPSHVVAPELLGCVMRYGELAGRIDEVEAYGGADDAASHAFRGPTRRNSVMFGPPGQLYVYFTYGMHHCANVVTGDDGAGEAVLIRSVVPLNGIDTMRTRRAKARNDRTLANGPGKLCAAFALDLSHNGVDLCRGELGIWHTSHSVNEVEITPRIGISKEIARPWRWRLVA